MVDNMAANMLVAPLIVLAVWAWCRAFKSAYRGPKSSYARRRRSLR